MESKAYTRKFLRIRPVPALYGIAGIVRIGGKQVRTGVASIRIRDIGTGGLRFSTTLRLPVDQTILLEISFQLAERSFCLRGFIVHVRPVEVGEYEYGLCFTEPDARLRESLARLLVRGLDRLDEHVYVLRFKD